MDVRDALNDLIKAGAYNRTALAKKAGISPAKLSGIISKRQKLYADEMFALCDVLNVSPEILRSFKRPPHDLE